MKLGAQDKKKVIIMAALLVIAIPLAIYNFSSVSGSTSPSPAAVAPAPAASLSHVAAAPKRRGIPQVREKTLDPTLRTDILAASQKIEYKGGARNIFRMDTAPVTIDKPSAAVRVTQEPPKIVINQPPLPPQIPLKYYGFSNRPGEAKKAFLQDGENIFVAVEGDVVERRYKIVKITNNSVLVEDVLNNNQQNINLTAPQTSGN
jgi:hypothetical protein